MDTSLLWRSALVQLLAVGVIFAVLAMVFIAGAVSEGAAIPTHSNQRTTS